MEKRSISYLALIAAIAFFFVGMGSGWVLNTSLTGGAQFVTIDVTGSTTCFPILDEAGKQFAIMNPNVDVSVSGTGSGAGIAATIDDITDIGISSRNIKSSENVSAGNDLIDYQFAKDGIAIIIDADNPDASAIQTAGLTVLDVFQIYNGTYTFWDDVVGTASHTAIAPFTRADGSGTRATFEELIVDGLSNELGDDAAYQTAVTGYQEVASNDLMVLGVAANTASIGYCGLGYLDASVIAIPIDGYDANTANVLSGDYPISRSLHMVTNGAVSGWVQAFIDFIFGYYGQQIVEQEGFIRIW